MRKKRWNGTAWVDDLPTVGVSNIETSGTPSSSTFLRGDGAWATPTATDSTKLPLTGGTLTGTLTSRAINMQNYTLSNVGQMSFNDPGPNEGISWSGGNFKIYESPNDLSTNSAGNLQFVSGGARRLTVQTDGTVYVPGTLKAEKVEIEGAIFDVETNSLRMPMVKGGHFNSDTSSVTGAISIVLPSGTYANATMMNFFVDVFDYAGGSDGESFTLHIGGYNYTDGTWHNVFANLVSGRTDRFFTVRFNYDSANSANIIYIAETTSNWAYPKVTVRDFSAGFSGADDADWYNNAFSISFATTLLGTTSRSKTAENVASNSLQLGGVNASSYLRSDADDTMSGTLTIDTGSSSDDALVIKGTSPTITFSDDSTGTDSNDDFYIHINGNNFYILADRDGNGNVGTGYETPHPLQLEADTNTGYLFGNRILTTSDEGSGNGIDADTLDGITSGSFLRSNADDIYTGTLTLGTNTTIKLPNSASYGIRTSTGHRVIDSIDATLRIGDTGKHSLITLHGQDADDFKVYYGATHYTLYHEGNKPSAGDVGAAAASHTHSDLVAVSGDTMTGDLTMQKDGSTNVGSHGIVFQANTSLDGLGDFTRELNIDSAGNLNYNGNTIFHEGNDGSASGLHADLLDGQQGSHYLDYNNFTNTPTIPTNNNQLTNGAGYVTGSHSHSTSNITSGEFNTARLGSGTATSGYVLQSDGDGTASWAAASGGAEPEWEYVAKVSGANPLTYSSMDALSNYEYKFVIEVVTTAEDTSNPYIRINNDSTAGETSYQYTRVQQTSSTGETETHSGSASSNLIYTGLALSSYSNGGTMVSTVHNSEFIYTISPYSSSPGIYTGIVDGWGSTHYSSQSGTSYDGMVQSRFTGRKRGIYQTEANRIDYYHDITAGSTDYSEMRVYRRPKK